MFACHQQWSAAVCILRHTTKQLSVFCDINQTSYPYFCQLRGSRRVVSVCGVSASRLLPDCLQMSRVCLSVGFEIMIESRLFDGWMWTKWMESLQQSYHHPVCIFVIVVGISIFIHKYSQLAAVCVISTTMCYQTPTRKKTVK